LEFRRVLFRSSHGWIHFKSADVAAVTTVGIGNRRIIEGAKSPALVGGSVSGTVVDGRAVPERGHSVSRTAVVLERAKPRIERAGDRAGQVAGDPTAAAIGLPDKVVAL